MSVCVVLKYMSVVGGHAVNFHEALFWILCKKQSNFLQCMLYLVKIANEKQLNLCSIYLIFKLVQFKFLG